MAKIQIPYLEVLITQLCNLHCDGCALYSNYTVKYEQSYKELKEYLRLWANRLQPQQFRIIGGEPFLHPRLIDIVQSVNESFPDSKRSVVTNGTNLQKHPSFPKIASETGTELHLSIHSDDPKYLAMLEPGIKILREWKKAYPGLNVTFGDYRYFTRGYNGVGSKMKPFEDHNPRESWKNCSAQQCKNIGGGRLYKCPQIMLLRETLEKFGLNNDPKWEKYLSYDGIGLDSSDDELTAFVTRQEEFICSMCPTKLDPYRKDVFNVNFETNLNRVEFAGKFINIQEYINSV